MIVKSGIFQGCIWNTCDGYTVKVRGQGVKGTYMVAKYKETTDYKYSIRSEGYIYCNPYSSSQPGPILPPKGPLTTSSNISGCQSGGVLLASSG